MLRALREVEGGAQGGVVCASVADWLQRETAVAGGGGGVVVATRNSAVKFARRQLDRLSALGLLSVQQHKTATKGSAKRYVLTDEGRMHL